MRSLLTVFLHQPEVQYLALDLVPAGRHLAHFYEAQLLLEVSEEVSTRP